MSAKAVEIYSDVYAESSAMIAILWVDIHGAPYSPSDIASISYSIIDMGENTSIAESDVLGHANVSLNVSDVMFAAESRTYNGLAQTVNFEWIIDNTTHECFPQRGHTYRLKIKPVPVSGLCSPVIYILRAK